MANTFRPSTSRTTVGDLTENDIIAAIDDIVGKNDDSTVMIGIGDDAAVVDHGRREIVLTTDFLVEGHDFRRQWSSGFDIGVKSAAQNMSDIAAMGATPVSLLVSLVLPADIEVSWVRDLYRGIRDECGRGGTRVPVVGGDLSAGPCVVIGVTATGVLADHSVCAATRCGAQRGNQVVICGDLGMSAAGLHLLQTGRDDVRKFPETVSEVAVRALAAHRRPRPPWRRGVSLASVASSMMDVSDGLLRDAERLATASGVSLALTQHSLEPFLEQVAPLADYEKIDPLEWVLAGGEDHALLCTVSKHEIPDDCIIIGDVEEGSSVPVTVDGRLWAGPTGWDHFDR